MAKKHIPTPLRATTRSVTAGVLGLALLVAGCGKAPQDNRYVFSQVQRTSTSRVWMPPAGGQTIQPPVLMNDVYSLWAPLSQQERRQAQISPRVTRFQSSVTAIAWLPPTEVDIMQDYLFRLVEHRRDVTNKALQRAMAHLPVVLEGLRALNLPPELACLPLVESAFEPGAVSSAGAAGIWQLMPGTARRFGLTVTKETDERFDVARATVAATAYLAYLYQMFGDWPLALAAYNYGEGNMQRAVDYTGERTLEGMMHWMAQDPNRPRVLPEETRRFVPSFAAAVVLMTQTDNLGIAAAPLVRLPSHRALPPMPPRAKAQGAGLPQAENNQQAFAPGTYRGPAVHHAAPNTPQASALPPATQAAPPMQTKGMQAPPPVLPKPVQAAPAMQLPAPSTTTTKGHPPVFTMPPTPPAPGTPGGVRFSAGVPAAMPLGSIAATPPATPVAVQRGVPQAAPAVPPLMRQPLPPTAAGSTPVQPKPQPGPLHTRQTFTEPAPDEKGAAQKRLEEKYVFQPNTSQTKARKGGPMPTKPLRMQMQQKPVPKAAAVPTAPVSASLPKPAPVLQPRPVAGPVPKALPASANSGPRPYTSPFPALQTGAKKTPPKPTGVMKKAVPQETTEPAQSKRVQ